MMARYFTGFPHKGTTVRPAVSILDRSRPYEPSWLRPARTTWVDRLGGHYGAVGERQAAKRG